MSINISKIKNKRLFVVVISLVFPILLLSLILGLDGPRIRKVIYDDFKLSREANQTIVLRANQPIDKNKEVELSIEPNVSHSVALTQDSVVIELKEKLDFDTEYRIDLRNLVSKNGRRSDYSTTIKTDEVAFYYLKRNYESDQNAFLYNKKPDSIVKSNLSGDNKEVHTDRKILDYVFSGNKILVLSIDEENVNRLTLLDEGNGSTEEINLPENGIVQSIKSTTDGRLIGFTFKEYEGDDVYSNEVLYIYDTKAKILKNISESESYDLPQVSDWSFHPDDSSLIVRDGDGSTYLIDSYGQEETKLLGTFQEIGNLSRDGRSLVVGNNFGELSVLNLVDYTFESIPTSKSRSILIGLKILQNRNGFLKQTNTFSEHDDIDTRALEISDDEHNKLLYSSNFLDTHNGEYNISSNNQYVSLEITDRKNALKIDDYNNFSRPTTVKTIIINSNTGKHLKEIDGANVIWR